MKNMVAIIFDDYIFIAKVPEHYCEIICVTQLPKVENQSKKHFKMDLLKQQND